MQGIESRITEELESVVFRNVEESTDVLKIGPKDDETRCALASELGCWGTDMEFGNEGCIPLDGIGFLHAMCTVFGDFPHVKPDVFRYFCAWCAMYSDRNGKFRFSARDARKF